jgi:hypothetical protein
VVLKDQSPVGVETVLGKCHYAIHAIGISLPYDHHSGGEQLTLFSPIVSPDRVAQKKMNILSFENPPRGVDKWTISGILIHVKRTPL